MDENRVIPLNMFLNTMKESCKNGKRYCFILGAGASKSSDIPTGEEMAKSWYEELTQLYSIDELRALQKRLNVRSIKPSSKNYFGLYAMRFWPEYSNGSAFLENALERARPSLGYYPLATLLASTENNLVITTNFDSLVEDALFIYTEKRPLVISHELLADYINFNTRRPIVAKLHRGIFFDPLNREEQVNGLSDKWKEILHQAFKIYTPVVIGYAGGDHSLMDFLTKEATVDGLYWCYRHEEPSSEILELVEKNNGYFLSIEGFDEMMYLLGQKFEYENPCGRIQSVAQRRVEKYSEQVQEFEDKLNALATRSEIQEQILKVLGQQKADELKELDMRIEKNPADAGAYEARGRIFYNAKDFDNAIADFDKVIELNGGDDMIYWYRGYSYVEKGRKEEGLQDYCKSLEIKEHTGVYNNRGLIYKALREYEKMLADFSRASELEPNCSGYHTSCAIACYMLKRYDEVLAHCTQAIELGKPTADTYKFLGDAYQAVQEYEKAIESYDAALNYSPGFAAAYNNRGLAYERLGQEKHALTDYRRAAKLDPSEPTHHTNVAEMLCRAGRFKEAVTSCNRALKLNPEYRRAYWFRSKAYEGQGQTAKAERDMETYKAMEED